MNKKPSIFRMKLVFFIIVLFFGATVIPNIDGYDKTNILSLRDATVDVLLNEDYLNAYWKFDNCSGVTLYDSSGNDYHGTIYGASWTGGYVGCALSFDGIDNYVDFDNHTSGIMFNKTDDIILSFWFKSSGEGLIFSSTAPWGNNPEFRIELLSNGSLLFYKITQLCGIILYSNGEYNDGTWHNAEYYFNGIESNTTVTLYVDGNLDAEITHYLCEVENDDYSKTRMGAHAHSSTDYYEGNLDEFKIYKYEQGNNQEPPLISGPKYGDPDELLEFSFLLDDPEEDDILSASVDWGDGNIIEIPGPYESGTVLNISYSWSEEGIYCIRTKSSDFWDESSWSDCYNIKIGNQPPEPPDIDIPSHWPVGVELCITFNCTDPDGDDIKYIIDWGDGEIIETGYYGSGVTNEHCHTYETKGTYIIRIRVIDVYGAESDWFEFRIEIPRTRLSFNSLFYLFLEHFPLLERLLGLII